ncbi:MAG: four helix bundle protein [Candidatus Magasanikbacteria bacterium CG_4_10_14_0_2_um_filter_33_14]|uniref:Four helix bundle protein n=1 Tax=Candidatus Magasanikbacteria bacterium CG_4_10_14_0_2_um_filter_33_14 TaxID=1974636 RepID=A0A2M7VB12_9BACT|nr:MAG: four helix bundle protein [Candidatus Magasanikbacteria bacterium CG_4_10_14_0_2_um_filter_33_14]
MNTFRFLDFPVYKQTKVFHKRILSLINGFENQYSLKDQISRASLSVILNIAEGSAKKSDKEFARFLETSISSMNEVVACLDIMQDLNLLSKIIYDNFLLEATSIVKQLGGFIRKLYS